MANYNTQQKKQILGFLSENASRAFSADEIVAAIADKGCGAPGRSTVYRLMGRLCDEGTVKRFIPDGQKRSLYQIAGGEECHHHLHLKCTECGKLLHMREAESEDVLKLIFGDCDFSVDREQTTLFGCCGDCRQKEQREKHIQ